MSTYATEFTLDDGECKLQIHQDLFKTEPAVLSLENRYGVDTPEIYLWREDAAALVQYLSSVMDTIPPKPKETTSV